MTAFSSMQQVIYQLQLELCTNIIQQMKGNISLQQLIPHPNSLRLLILHTPFPLILDPLVRCINLIKLDVSNNNIQKIPYLGNLKNLRFLFIHNNKVEFEHLRQVFQERPSDKVVQMSPLAKNIVWVTYWGNHNQFYARHYLITNTLVAAIDKNIVTQEEKSEKLFNMVEPFSEITQIAFPLIKLEGKHSSFSEEQYITYFYQQLHLIRKKQVETNPALRIQKVWRGYVIRKRLSKVHKKEKIQKQKIIKIVKHWISFTKKKIKLRQIMKKRQKQYLLYDLKDYKRVLIYKKLLLLAQAAKMRVAQKNVRLKNQKIIYRLFNTNYHSFKCLYDYMKLDKYPEIYINSEDLQIFQKIIIPFAKKFHKDREIKIEDQKDLYVIRSGKDSETKWPFGHILSYAIHSEIMYIKNVAISKKKIFPDIKIQCSFKKVHLSFQEQKRSKQAYQILIDTRNIQNKGIMVIKNEPKVLRDIIRGIYFFNRKVIGKGFSPSNKILVIPKLFAKLVNSALKIQKVWKGYKTRKQLSKLIQMDILRFRAAKKIQKWFRNLASAHRKCFMINTQYEINKFTDRQFCIELNQYLQLGKTSHEKKMKFLEQEIEIKYQRISKSIVINWDSRSQKSTVQKNIEINKPLFNSEYQKSIFGSTIPNLINTYLADIYHIIHFNTEIKILYSKNTKKYMMVECASTEELRMRLLALYLLTYNFKKHKHIKIFSPLQLNQATKIAIWKKQIIENENCLFIFTQNHVPYFKKELDKFNHKVRTQQLMIYLKQTRNSFPFKVVEEISFASTTNINLKQKQEYSNDEAKQLVRQKVRLKKHNISLGIKQSNNGQIKNEKNKQIELKSNKTHNKIIVKSVDKFNQLNLLPHVQTKRSFTRAKHSRIKTQGKTEGQELEVEGRQKRFLTEVTVDQQAIALQQRKSKQESKTFTTNFINISNFLSKQYQKSYIRKKEKATSMQIVESVIQRRMHQKKSSEKLKRNKYLKQKFIRDNFREYESEIQQQLSFQNIKQSKPKQEAEVGQKKSKIHIVFPQQCYPLFPALN